VTAPPVPPAAAGVRDRARTLVARRPEAGVYALAVAAGLAVVGLAAAGPAHHPAGGGAGWSGWMLMTLATMLPVVAPQVRRVALRSLWRRRHRAVTGFLAGYLALWGAVGVGVVGLLAVVPPPPGAVVAVLVAGAAWQVTPVRRRVLGRCGSTRPAPVRGWAADRACVAAGWRAGGRCLVTCGPAMLAMALGHSLLLMLGLLALLLDERARGPNPHRRAGAAVQAWGFLACAAVLAAAR
jgi:Predicted metal-binding integral membrane protein (DUF2182)